MTDTPRLETERLRIVPFQERHLTERYVGWLNDPDIVRYSNQRFKEHTLEGCREYMESFGGSTNHFWALEVREQDAYIGTMTAYIDEHNGVADIGILIGETDFWGRGFGTEAFGAVARHLLKEGGLRKVTAGTLEVNEGMLGIMDNLGMVDDGRRRRHGLYQGKAVDMVHKALFREDLGGDVPTTED